MANGRSCPALLKRNRPVGRSSTPMKKVTNMFCSLRWQVVSFNACMMRAGLVSCADIERNKVCITAITKAAGTPFPLTSPIQKNSFSSRMKWSYKSPPTILAGSSEPTTLQSSRIAISSTLGNMSIWIFRAIFNSLSMCSRSKVACCSLEMFLAER